MKRIVSFFLLLVMVAGLLAACGETQTPTPTTGAAAQPTNTTEAQSQPTEQAANTPEPAPTNTPEAPAAEATPAEPTPETIGGGATRLVIWHGWQGTYAETIKRLLGEYAQKNNLTLELLAPPSMNDRVNVAIPAGEGPDIIAWVNDQIGKNAEIDVIQPLDDKGIDRAYLEQNFVGTAVEAVTYKDQTWCVPETMEAIAFVYNKDLVPEDQLPKDTNELLQKAQEFNQANSGKYYFVYQANGDPYHNAPWWYGYGAFYVNEAGDVGLDTPESIQAGQFLKQLTTIMPKEVDYDVSRALMTEGNAGIWMTGPWAIADIQKAGINFGVAPIPTVSETGKPGTPFVGVKCMMLAQGAENPEAAIELMKYYGSAEFQTALAQELKLVPANKQAQDAVKSDPVVAGFLASANNGTPLPSTPFMALLWGPAGDAQRAIWTGTQEPEQALQDAAEIARQNVEQIK